MATNVDSCYLDYEPATSRSLIQRSAKLIARLWIFYTYLYSGTLWG